MNNTRYSRWDQIFADAIKRLKRAGYDVRELRQQFNFYKKEVLQHHRAQQAEQQNDQRSLAFHFGAYGSNADGIRSLDDNRLQPLRFPSDLSYSPRTNVREFMCDIRQMLEIHLRQHSDEGGTSKVLNRVTKEIRRVQTSWL